MRPPATPLVAGVDPRRRPARDVVHPAGRHDAEAAFSSQASVAAAVYGQEKDLRAHP